MTSPAPTYHERLVERLAEAMRRGADAAVDAAGKDAAARPIDGRLLDVVIVNALMGDTEIALTTSMAVIATVRVVSTPQSTHVDISCTQGETLVQAGFEWFRYEGVETIKKTYNDLMSEVVKTSYTQVKNLG